MNGILMLCIMYCVLCIWVMFESYMGVNLVLKIKVVLNEFYLISKVEVCVYDNVCNMVIKGCYLEYFFYICFIFINNV